VKNRTEVVDIGDFIDQPNRLAVLVAGVDSQHRVGERLKADAIDHRQVRQVSEGWHSLGRQAAD